MGLQLTVRGSSEIWRLAVEFFAKHNGGEAEKSAVQSLSFQVNRREEGDFHRIVVYCPDGRSYQLKSEASF